MKLKNYLTEYISDKNDVMAREEDPTLNETLKVLEKDCSQFIKETGGFLFRGTNRKLGEPYKKMKARKDRKPLDTSTVGHELADKLFKKKFGWKVRSEGVFTTNRTTMARGYGVNVYMFFPVNGYKYVWSEDVVDFFITYVDAKNNNSGQTTPELMNSIVNEYTNKGLKNVWDDRKTREVIFYCPNGYYMVNTLMIGELSYYFNIERI